MLTAHSSVNLKKSFLDLTLISKGSGWHNNFLNISLLLSVCL